MKKLIMVAAVVVVAVFDVMGGVPVMMKIAGGSF
jgi:hypothetical protein